MKKNKITEEGTPPRRANGTSDPLGPSSEIGRKLRQYYDDLVTEDVPDRFADLLKQLEQAGPRPDKG